MKTNKEQQTKETKSLKEVVYDNRGKIIAGIGLVGCSVLTYMLFKNRNKVIELNTRINILDEDIRVLADDNQTLSEILSEGVLQDAITTTLNKIGGRTNKLRMLEEQLKSRPNDDKIIDKITKIKGELDILLKRKDLYTTKLNKFEIKDLVE